MIAALGCYIKTRGGISDVARSCKWAILQNSLISQFPCALAIVCSAYCFTEPVAFPNCCCSEALLLRCGSDGSSSQFIAAVGARGPGQYQRLASKSHEVRKARRNSCPQSTKSITQNSRRSISFRGLTRPMVVKLGHISLGIKNTEFEGVCFQVHTSSQDNDLFSFVAPQHSLRLLLETSLGKALVAVGSTRAWPLLSLFSKPHHQPWPRLSRRPLKLLQGTYFGQTLAAVGSAPVGLLIF